MLKCPFHKNCSYPCPVEALLHLEIQAMQTRNPKLLAALRRGGKRGGQAHSGEKMVPTAKTLVPKTVREQRLLTLVPALSTTTLQTKTSTDEDE